MKFPAIVFVFRLASIIGTVLVVGGASQRLIAQAPQPIDQLRFKATHNSYDRGRPPEEQIDNFGVWAIELDVSVPIEEDRPPRLVIGHDGAGKALGTDDLSGGDPQASYIGDRFRLEYYLMRIKDTWSMRYRPVLIYFEKKRWIPLITVEDRDYDDPARFLGLLENELRSVFGDKIFGPRALDAYVAQRGQYPSAPELAGFVIPILNQFYNGVDSCINGTDLVFHDMPCPPDHPVCHVPPVTGCHVPPVTHGCDCRPFKLSAGVHEGCGLPGNLESFNIYRLDDYQADNTFEHVVPPNPLVVDFGAPSATRINGCDEDVDVHEQGTILFPYRTIGKAVGRAEGRIIPNGSQLLQRPGLDWTVLIRPGSYPETLTINIPLTDIEQGR